MGAGRVLINAARGGVVDEPALGRGLARAGRGCRAGRVRARAAPRRGGAAVRRLPDLILTPHIAGVTEESNGRVSSLTAANVLHELDRAGA